MWCNWIDRLAAALLCLAQSNEVPPIVQRIYVRDPRSSRFTYDEAVGTLIESPYRVEQAPVVQFPGLNAHPSVAIC